MKHINNIKILSFLLLLVILLFQFNKSSGQNLILLHRNGGKQNVFVKTGTKVKIETLDDQIIKGRIIAIKDSSIIIGNKTENEISINKIKYFYFRKNNVGKYVGGAFLTVISYIGTGVAIFGLANLSTSPALVVISLSGIAAVSDIGTYHWFAYKRRYDIQNKYNIFIVKPKA